MSINTLRRKLDQRGLSVDGTCEILVRSLEEKEGVIVEGAGIPKVNGHYMPAGEFDCSPQYKKSVKFQGRDEVFTLF